jgi:hypothetical protein
MIWIICTATGERAGSHRCVCSTVAEALVVRALSLGRRCAIALWPIANRFRAPVSLGPVLEHELTSDHTCFVGSSAMLPCVVRGLVDVDKRQEYCSCTAGLRFAVALIYTTSRPSPPHASPRCTNGHIVRYEDVRISAYQCRTNN